MSFHGASLANTSVIDGCCTKSDFLRATHFHSSIKLTFKSSLEKYLIHFPDLAQRDPKFSPMHKSRAGFRLVVFVEVDL